jgi:hypothetical protein
MTTCAGVGLAPKAERGLEFYRTPIEATRALIALEGDRIPARVWEPACGDGAISSSLKEARYVVHSTDIVDRGYGDEWVDFLSAADSRESNAVVTNPPYTLAQEFVDKAFSFPSISYCALLLRLSFAHSCLKPSLAHDAP